LYKGIWHAGFVPQTFEEPESLTDITPEILSAWKEASLIRGTPACRKIVFRLKSKDQGWGGRQQDHGTYTGSYSWFDVGKERLKVLKGDWGSKMHVKNEYHPYYPFDNEDMEDDANAMFKPQASMAAKDRVKFTLDSLDPKPIVLTNDRPARDLVILDHPALPGAKNLQCNKVAGRKMVEHVITWRWDDDIDPTSPEAKALADAGRGIETGTGEFVRGLQIGDVVTVWARSRFPGWVNNVESCTVDVYWAV
jgi:hypothetical protein